MDVFCLADWSNFNSTVRLIEYNFHSMNKFFRSYTALKVIVRKPLSGKNSLCNGCGVCTNYVPDRFISVITI